MKTALLSFCSLYAFTQGQQYVPIATEPTVPAVPVVPAVPTVPLLPEFVPIPTEPTAPGLIDPLPIVDPPVVIVDPLPLPQPGTTASGTTAAPVVPVVPVVPPNAPATTMAPGTALGAFGQTCQTTGPTNCVSPLDLWTAALTPGVLRCDLPFSCCLCASIECTDCEKFIAGDSGVFGVGAITVSGASYGAEIICQGEKSCAESIMTATNIKSVAVSGYLGTQNAVITITDPVADFKLDCTGLSSCDGLKIELIIPASPAGTYCGYTPLRLGGILCSGFQSCKGVDITVNNMGCNKVILDTVACTEIDACLSANFNFIGDVDIQNCDLGSSGHTATGISKCYQNLQALLCQEPSACAGITKTLTNPSSAFSLQCGSDSSCAGAQLTLNFNSQPWYNQATGVEFGFPTEWIDGFKFSGANSGAGATITFNNQQRGKTLEIENIECVAAGACTGTTFILGPDVEIVDVLCDWGACDGCMVKIDATDPGRYCTEFVNI